MEVKESSATYLARSRYQQTKLGEIPADWILSPIHSFAEVRGRVGWKGYTKKDLVEYGPYAIGAKHIDSRNRLDLSDPTYLSKSKYLESPEIMVRAGDVLIVQRGTIGKLVWVDQPIGEATINPSMVIIRTRSVCPGFIAYYLLSHSGQKQILADTSTTGVPMISQRQIENFLVPLPPTRHEQEAVAEALSDVDALIDSLERLVIKKRQIKQGAMQELLTGAKRLPGFIGEWEVKALGELFNFSGGLSASRDQLSAEGYCYLHYGDIHLSIKSFIDVRAEFQNIPKLKVPLNKVAAKSLLADGDVVFVDASEDDEGASKHVVVVNPDNTPLISGLHTIVAKEKSAELNHLYRRYCFQTRKVRAQFRFFAVGTKVSGISKTNIAKVTLPVPSVAEQAAITSILSDMDTELDALEMKLAKARDVKQGMMQELLTGRVRLV